MVQGNVGTYKVAYVKDKTHILYSRMFDKIEAALDFAHKLPNRWLLFQKIGHDGDDYAWKLLPYGAYKSYKAGIKLDSMRVLLGIMAFIAVVYLAKKIFSAKPKMPVF
jgi:hypothetical protein